MAQDRRNQKNHTSITMHTEDYDVNYTFSCFYMILNAQKFVM